jgi:hypothetical protein
VIAAHGDAKLIPDVRVIESPCYAARLQDIAWRLSPTCAIRPSITNVQCALVIPPGSCNYGKRPKPALDLREIRIRVPLCEPLDKCFPMRQVAVHALIWTRSELAHP